MDGGEELRIVLLGKTGVGKSAVGNRILEVNMFKDECSPESGTQICKREEKVINGRRIVVIDTPGIFDTNRTEKELKYEIISCLVECAPGPHIFILVLKVDRHTQENQQALEKLEKYFTGDAVHHMVLLFTHGEDLKENMTIHDFIDKSEVVGKKGRKQSLKGLVERCGNRVHVIDNKHWDEKSRVSAVLDSLQGLNLSEQALREITEKMAQTPGEQTPWFNVLSDNGGNAEAAGNEEQRKYRDNRFQLTQLMRSVKEILTRSNSGHYSNETLVALGEAINEEVHNILCEMGVKRDIRNPDKTENDKVDMVEIKRRARERVRKKIRRHLAGVTVGILLGALLGVGVGLAAPVVLVAGLIRAGCRWVARKAGGPPAQEADSPAQEAGPSAQEADSPEQEADSPAQEADSTAQEADSTAQEADSPAQEAGLTAADVAAGLAAGAGAAVGVSAGAGFLALYGAGKGLVCGHEMSKTSDNPTQAVGKTSKAVTQKAVDVLNTCWNLGNSDTGGENETN